MGRSHSMPPFALNAGDRLGAYLLVKQVEVDGPESTWLAHRAKDDGGVDTFAVRILDPTRLPTHELARWFDCEMNLAAQLGEVQAQGPREHGQHEGIPYLVLDWIEGLGLRQLEPALGRLADGDSALWLGVIVEIVEQVLRALATAHGQATSASATGLVHGDLRPEAILVTSTGEVCLRGFGRAQRPSIAGSTRDVMALFRYAAPERLRSQASLPANDLYGVGAIMHELVSRDLFPTPEGPRSASTTHRGSAKVPSLQLALPPELERLRVALLDPQIHNRVATCARAIELIHLWPGRADHRELLGSLVTQTLHGVGRAQPVLPEPAAVSLPNLASPIPSASDESTMVLDDATLAALRRGHGIAPGPAVHGPEPIHGSAIHGSAIHGPEPVHGFLDTERPSPSEPPQPERPMALKRPLAPVERWQPAPTAAGPQLSQELREWPAALPSAPAPLPSASTPRPIVRPQHSRAGAAPMDAARPEATGTDFVERHESHRRAVLLVIGIVAAIALGVGVGAWLVADGLATPAAPTAR